MVFPAACHVDPEVRLRRSSRSESVQPSLASQYKIELPTMPPLTTTTWVSVFIVCFSGFCGNFLIFRKAFIGKCNMVTVCTAHEKHSLVGRGTLSKPATIEGKEFPRGTDLSFRPNGELLMADYLKPISLMPIGFGAVNTEDKILEARSQTKNVTGK